MAWFRDLFVSATHGGTAQAELESLAGPPAEGNGEFLTPQTLTTFAGATFAISIISGVVQRLFPASSGTWVGTLVALGVGMFLMWVNLTDPRVRRKLRSGRDWSLAVAVGLVNCVYLIAISNGVFETIEVAASAP